MKAEKWLSRCLRQTRRAAVSCVSSGLLKQEIDIQFLADLRPLIAVGLIEGSVNFNNFDRNKLHSVNRDDGFEDQLTEIADWGGDTSLNGRAAMFLKGKVRGDYLLTLAYDSDKSRSSAYSATFSRTNIIRCMAMQQPKALKLNRPANCMCAWTKGAYAMYGDYVTRTESIRRLIACQYNRSLTGFKAGA